MTVDFGSPALRSSEELVEGAEWSATDHRGNVLYAKEGALYRRFATGHADRLVADLREMTTDAQRAPAWARTPLMKR